MIERVSANASFVRHTCLDRTRRASETVSKRASPSGMVQWRWRRQRERPHMCHWTMRCMQRGRRACIDHAHASHRTIVEKPTECVRVSGVCSPKISTPSCVSEVRAKKTSVRSLSAVTWLWLPPPCPCTPLPILPVCREALSCVSVQACVVPTPSVTMRPYSKKPPTHGQR